LSSSPKPFEAAFVALTGRAKAAPALARAAILVAIVAAALAGAGALAFRLVPRLAPYGARDRLEDLRFSQVVLDSEGGELQVLPLDQGLRRVFVPLGEMPPALVDIVLTAEDRRFRLHPGVDPLAVLRAAAQNRSAGTTVSGASTIAMQLSRLLRAERRGGKLLEAWEALQLESRLGKRGVLELYLNLVPFGRNVEGFPAAARVFFGKPLGQLTRSELLILAVVPRSPGRYDPYAQAGNNLAAVRRLGLARGGADSLEAAYSRMLDPGRPGIWPFRAPHYVRWLEGRPELAALDGREPLRTSIEPALQLFLEDLLARSVEEARPKRVSNAAALFLRPGDMRIAAWVGSVDFADELAQGQVDGVTMRRQPGSTLKPFLYAMALEQGFTAASVLPDVPTDFGGAEVYTPANFNDQFNGPVRLRQALASSLNVPAVVVLQRLGVLPFTDRLIAAGFESLEAQRGGLGLALGNAELCLFELVQAYGLFLHEGKLAPIQAVAAGGPAPGPAPDAANVRRSSSLGAGGTDGAARPAVSRRVIEPESANLIRDILTRHPDRVLAFGRESGSRLTFDGAMKTGTSNQFNNIWAVGFTTDLLGGVWMGNFGGQTVVGTADSGYPARVMRSTLESFSGHEPFPPLEGFVRREVCALSGMAAGELCPHAIEEWFRPGIEPPTCDWHLRGPDGKVEVRYPQEYRAWLDRYRYRPSRGYRGSELAILRPLDGAVFYLDPGLPLEKQELAIEATGTGLAELEIDGEPYDSGPFPLRAWYRLKPGRHLISLSDGERLIESAFEVR